MGDCGEAGILVGYKGKKIYRIYIPSGLMIIETLHVTLMESSVANLPSDDQESDEDDENPVLQHPSSTGQKPSAVTQWEEELDPTPAPHPRLEGTDT
jgi:hypothetical protein